METGQILDSVYGEVVRFYKNINIPTKERNVVHKQISRLYEEYLLIKSIKNRKRSMYRREKEKLSVFEKSLDNLIDIVVPNAKIDNDKYKTFLENQRKPGRPGKTLIVFLSCVK